VNLLIVENDLVVSRVWKKTFGKKFNVVQVYHAPEAIQALEANPIDLVILDIRLNGPRPSGLEVYDYIRGNMESDIPIAFITGLEDSVDVYQQAAIASETDQKGQLFTVLVKKPIRLKELSTLLDKMAARDFSAIH
jgi:CheY-like chemotaxis protein